MSDRNEDLRVSGLFYREPREGAPDFVKGSVGINWEMLLKWKEEQGITEDFTNVDFLISKQGKPYTKWNKYKSENQNKEDDPYAQMTSEPNF